MSGVEGVRYFTFGEARYNWCPSQTKFVRALVLPDSAAHRSVDLSSRAPTSSGVNDPCHRTENTARVASVLQRDRVRGAPRARRRPDGRSGGGAARVLRQEQDACATHAARDAPREPAHVAVLPVPGVRHCALVRGPRVPVRLRAPSRLPRLPRRHRHRHSPRAPAAPALLE